MRLYRDRVIYGDGEAVITLNAGDAIIAASGSLTTTAHLRTFDGATASGNITPKFGLPLFVYAGHDGAVVNVAAGSSQLAHYSHLGKLAVLSGFGGGMDRFEKRRRSETGLTHISRANDSRLSIQIKLRNHPDDTDPALLSDAAALSAFWAYPCAGVDTSAYPVEWLSPWVLRPVAVSKFKGWNPHRLHWPLGADGRVDFAETFPGLAQTFAVPGEGSAAPLFRPTTTGIPQFPLTPSTPVERFGVVLTTESGRPITAESGAIITVG